MNETPTAVELTAARITALAARLEASPREVLALAASLERDHARQLDGARLDYELARIRASGAAVSAIDILLLGYASFALDDLDRALKLVWSDVEVGSS